MKMRDFVRMWELLYSDKSLALKVEKIEQEMKTQGESLQKVFQIVNQLLKQPKPMSRKIGFRIDEK